MRSASVVVPFPLRHQGGRLDLVRLVPSARALLVAFGLLAGVLVAYVAARETSMFAVRTVQVDGAPPGVARKVERALASEMGESLLAMDLAAAEEAVEELPVVAEATFDRAFPHTLRVLVSAERRVAVIRQGARAYLVSRRARVIARIPLRTAVALPRIWVPKGRELTPGLMLDGDLETAVRAVTPLVGSGFPSRVSAVEATDTELTLHLRSGLEVRLGDASDVDLKLAVAQRVIPLLQPGSLFLDVSVVERPVAGTTLESQVEVESQGSTPP
ncbi:MAG TPA: FtsQ-type POTRA domain-containing protein [Gaiella sp.]|jgi:cell division protein FtsQ